MREKPTPYSDSALTWIRAPGASGCTTSKRRCRFRQCSPILALRNTGFAHAEQLHDQLSFGIEGLPTGNHAIGAGLAHAPQLGNAGSLTDAFSVNAGLFNLTDKQYWQWGDVQGLDANSRSLGRYTQPGRNASVNLVWEI